MNSIRLFSIISLLLISILLSVDEVYAFGGQKEEKTRIIFESDGYCPKLRDDQKAYILVTYNSHRIINGFYRNHISSHSTVIIANTTKSGVLHAAITVYQKDFPAPTAHNSKNFTLDEGSDEITADPITLEISLRYNGRNGYVRIRCR